MLPTASTPRLGSTRYFRDKLGTMMTVNRSKQVNDGEKIVVEDQLVGRSGEDEVSETGDADREAANGNCPERYA